MKLIVFSGLPDTGKSTLAESLGSDVGIPVFAKDRLEATLLRSGLTSVDGAKSLGFVGLELLTARAERQLMLGQSVILDSVASIRSVRDSWHRFAEQYGAYWHVIECICSDETPHRSQLKDRKRNIPGWHQLEWSAVERVRRYHLPEEEHLVFDMVHPFDENVLKARKYCE
jgi:predicted kinase